MWRGAGGGRYPLAIVDQAVCKFCFRAATLDKYLLLLHSDFPRHDGHFDRLVGAQSIEFGLTTGSGENRQGSLGQLLQWFERGQNFAAQSRSISRG
jgi:hypothetical protein